MKTSFLAILAVVVSAECATRIPLERHRIERPVRKQQPKMDIAAVEAIFTKASDCLQSLFNPDSLQKEVEDAKTNDTLDEFSKINCAKSDQMRVCLETLNADISPYLDDTLRDLLTSLSKSNSQIMDFFCEKDGLRLSLFVSEGGPECFKEKTPIEKCSRKINENYSTLEEIVSLAIKNQCAKFEEMSRCMVDTLKDCPTLVAAYTAESFFRSIKIKNECNITADIVKTTPAAAV